MQTRYANPYASPSANGIGQERVPAGYRDQCFDYLLDVVLTASQALSTQVSINNDSDFVWRAVVNATSTGLFSVRFSDSDFYFLSNAPIVSTNLQGDAASPYPILPEIVIPSGGRIGVDITDLSVAGNTIQLLFRGVKRYAV